MRAFLTSDTARRTAEFDVLSAWRALLGARSPRELGNYASSKDVARLFEARAEVKTEVNRCARQPPTFSGDGRVALVRISSPAQVHPVRCIVSSMGRLC